MAISLKKIVFAGIVVLGFAAATVLPSYQITISEVAAQADDGSEGGRD